MATTIVPTTSSPTTVVPTTVSPTTVSPTTIAPTTVVPMTSVPTTPPPAAPEPTDYKWFNCLANNYQGVLIAETTIDGLILNPSFDGSDLEVVTAIYAMAVESRVISDAMLEVETEISGTAISNTQRSHWVGWSKIGDISFELDRTNDAGFRPMEWPGFVYQILKLDNKAVVYGSGGVTIAIPVTEPMATFGFKDIYNVGVKNKTAIAGDEFTHYFIDKLGCLCKLTSEGLEKLGFEEFLSPLVNPVMIYEKGERHLYIGDEDNGYIVNNNAMGGGYGNLTGLYRLNNSLTGVSPSDIIISPIYIVTDVIDFRHRGIKTIESFQLGVDHVKDLQCAVDYKYRTNEEFKTTHWTVPNDEGVVHLRIAATDFRIRIKSIVHTSFELSYINIQYKSIDKRFMRGRMDSPEEAEE